MKLFQYSLFALCVTSPMLAMDQESQPQESESAVSAPIDVPMNRKTPRSSPLIATTACSLPDDILPRVIIAAGSPSGNGRTLALQAAAHDAAHFEDAARSCPVGSFEQNYYEQKEANAKKRLHKMQGK